MTPAPNTSTYLLLNPDVLDLPNSFVLRMGNGLVLNNSGTDSLDGGTATINLVGILNTLISLPSTSTGILSKTAYNAIQLIALKNSDGTILVENGDGVAGNPTFSTVPLTTPQLIQLQLDGLPVGLPQQAVNFASTSSVGFSVTENANIYTVTASAITNAASDWASFAAVQNVDFAQFGLLDVSNIEFVANTALPPPSANGALALYFDGTNTVLAFTQSVSAGGNRYFLPLSDVEVPVIGDLMVCKTAGSYDTITPGNTGDVLTSNGPGQIPSYQPGGAASWSTYQANSALNMNNFGITNATSLSFVDTGLPTVPGQGFSSVNPGTTASIPVWTNQNSNFYLPLSTVIAPGTGDLLCCNGGGAYATLSAGTDTFVLTSNGPGQVPSYQPIASQNWSTVPATQDVNMSDMKIYNLGGLNVMAGEQGTGTAQFGLVLNGGGPIPDSLLAQLWMRNSTMFTGPTGGGTVLGSSATGLFSVANDLGSFTVPLSSSQVIPAGGDILVGAPAGAGCFNPLPIGAAGTVLGSDGTTVSWVSAGSGGANWSTVVPTQDVQMSFFGFTQLGGLNVGFNDTIQRGYGLALSASPNNSLGQILMPSSTLPSATGLGSNMVISTQNGTLCATVATGNYSIPFNTVTTGPNKGDILVGNSTYSYTPLPIGAAGTVLGSDGTNATWLPAGSGATSTYLVKTAAFNTNPSSTALPAFTYANGTGGVGATITFTTAGALDPLWTDNVTLALGDAVLLYDQISNPQCNGIYIVTTLGAPGVAGVWTRAPYYNSNATMINGTQIVVRSGYPSFKGFVATSTTATSFLNGQVFAQFSTVVNVGVAGMYYDFSGWNRVTSICTTPSVSTPATVPVITVPYNRQFIPTGVIIYDNPNSYIATLLSDASTGGIFLPSASYAAQNGSTFFPITQPNLTPLINFNGASNGFTLSWDVSSSVGTPGIQQGFVLTGYIVS